MKSRTFHKQLSLPGMQKKRTLLAHGGEHSLGKRKTKRPIDPKQALHVVLRSSHAKGDHSLLHPKNCDAIKGLLDRLKKRWGITVYQFANVGNHLHLLIRAKSRASWQGFIREFSGGVAMLVTGARKGLEFKKKAVRSRSFWDYLVFTRIVSFGRDFQGVSRYVLTNFWEAGGVAVRKLLARGFKILEISREGAVFVPS